MRELTEQQAEFAREYARNGGDGTAAALKAGFSERSAGQRAYELRQKPHVIDAIHREQRRMFTDLASIALGQAKLMLEDPKTPAGARVELMKMTFDRAGLAALRSADEPPGEGKPLRDMTIEELEEIARSLRSQRGDEEAEPERRAA